MGPSTEPVRRTHRLNWKQFKDWLERSVSCFACLDKSSGIYNNLDTLTQLHEAINTSPSIRETPELLDDILLLEGPGFVAIDKTAATTLRSKLRGVRRPKKYVGIVIRSDKHGAIVGKGKALSKDFYEQRKEEDVAPGGDSPTGEVPRSGSDSPDGTSE